MKNLKCGTLTRFTISKFTVIKNEDVTKYCTSKQKTELRDLCKTINIGKELEGKKTKNEYTVVNNDEPYAPEIIKILEDNIICEGVYK